MREMQSKLLEEILKYDGTQLASLWAFRQHDLQGDSIVAFQGPCHVALTEMVDLADVKEEAHIYSEKMLHFIVEHFDLDLEKTVTRQRLLVAIIKEKLEEGLDLRLKRKGDDLYWQGRKLSVSIATLSPVSSLIHLGLNILSDNTPVPTISLQELGIKDIEEFAKAILQAYTQEIASINLARCKVRGVN